MLNEQSSYRFIYFFFVSSSFAVTLFLTFSVCNMRESREYFELLNRLPVYTIQELIYQIYQEKTYPNRVCALVNFHNTDNSTLSQSIRYFSVQTFPPFRFSHFLPLFHSLSLTMVGSLYLQAHPLLTQIKGNILSEDLWAI